MNSIEKINMKLNEFSSVNNSKVSPQGSWETFQALNKWFCELRDLFEELRKELEGCAGQSTHIGC
jgi:hypothetical protein